MIVCGCTGTTDRAIRKMMREGASTPADISRRCGAGGCCQACHEEISTMLAGNRPHSQEQPVPACE